VRLAFLEFMPPSMIEAGAELAAAGCSRIDVVPLFLGAGGHVRKDVPGLFAQLQAAHPGVRFTLHRALGESPAVISAMAVAAATLIDDHSAFP
jgi:sirohydrochlorin cobaltochelatase